MQASIVMTMEDGSTYELVTEELDLLDLHSDCTIGQEPVGGEAVDEGWPWSTWRKAPPAEHYMTFSLRARPVDKKKGLLYTVRCDTE